MKKISVITVYNDRAKLESQLLASLKLQDIEYELIAIDNSADKYKSAASAYNAGGGYANSDLLVFTHQDITLKTPSELRKFAEYIEQFEVGDIIGAAGVKYGGENGCWNLTGGKEYISEIKEKISEPIEAFSLDEVFIGMKKETFEMYHFNEKVCDNWHLYAVEICLHAIKEGHKNYIVPVQIHHFSWGNINSSFHKTMKNLLRQYHGYFKTIWTTCIIVSTNRLFLCPIIYNFNWYRYKYRKYKKVCSLK